MLISVCSNLQFTNILDSGIVLVHYSVRFKKGFIGKKQFLKDTGNLLLCLYDNTALKLSLSTKSLASSSCKREIMYGKSAAIFVHRPITSIFSVPNQRSNDHGNITDSEFQICRHYGDCTLLKVRTYLKVALKALEGI